ncbi:hypothetical protein K502DRAFT_332099 [Neoconidiobolus thromboides FSU 785]|nr:hypothetical protein K502DRAFT_332099 [Neoconidiobolus thromboides FSU 785]
MIGKLMVKRRIRSNHDRMKEQMQKLAITINNHINFIGTINDAQLHRVSYEYLSWVKHRLIKSREKKEHNQLNEIEAINRMEVFKTEMDHYLKIYFITNSPIITNRETNFIPNLFDFGRFLETGLKVMPGLLDPCNLWLGKDTLLQVTKKNREELLTYVYFALLARFTLSKNSQSYKLIYSNSLKNIRLLLPEAYSTPTHNNIIAISLLSHLALSHSNFGLVERYFFSAVRMAEILGYNLEEERLGSIDNLIFHSKRGKNLWNTLYLSYIAYSATILDFPVYHFQIDSINLTPYLNTEHCEFLEIGQNEVGKKSSKHAEFFNSLVAVNLANLRHSLNIKSENQTIITLIENEELKLPLSEFNSYCTTLMNCNMELNSNDIVDKNTQLNVYRFFKVLIDTTIISLYYPVILLAPKPVDFLEEESRLLYNLANTSFEIMFQLDNNENTTTFITNLISEVSVLVAGLEMNQNIFSCSQFCYLIYVYWNIISNASNNDKKSFDVDKVNKSKERGLIVLKAVKELAVEGRKTLRSDAKLNLKQVDRALDRFQLPPEYIKKVKEIMNN